MLSSESFQVLPAVGVPASSTDFHGSSEIRPTLSPIAGVYDVATMSAREGVTLRLKLGSLATLIGVLAAAGPVPDVRKAHTRGPTVAWLLIALTMSDGVAV